jgi:hypothetical protein
MLEELVEDHLGDGLSFQFDNDPHPFPVRFIPEVGDPFNPFLLDELGNLFQEPGLIHLIGEFRDYYRLPLCPLLAFDQGAGS